MTSFGRLSFFVGILVFVSGLIGFGRIWVLSLTLGSGLILFLFHPLSLSRILRLGHFVFWLNLILLMQSFVKLGYLFCRSGHPVVTADQFLAFVGHLLPQEPLLDLPRITDRDLHEVARAKKSNAGGLDGWAWNEIKALPLPWFSGLAVLLEFFILLGFG